MAKSWRKILVIASVAFALFATQPAGAQSGGCAGGPFAGATTLDSDGDGVTDSDEVVSGTDECDPNDTPTLVCGSYVANYDAASFDADNDTHSDADEVAAGSDPCDGTSVIAATATPTTTAAPATTAAPTTAAATGGGTATAAPTLALTGPSTATLMVIVAFAMMLLGLASLAVGRRVEQA